MTHIEGPDHEQGTHHWQLTLDGIGSYSGTCTPAPGETRYDLSLRIRARVLEAEGWTGKPPTTLFFDVQPNQMEATE